MVLMIVQASQIAMPRPRNSLSELLVLSLNESLRPRVWTSLTRRRLSAEVNIEQKGSLSVNTRSVSGFLGSKQI